MIAGFLPIWTVGNTAFLGVGDAIGDAFGGAFLLKQKRNVL